MNEIPIIPCKEDFLKECSRMTLPIYVEMPQNTLTPVDVFEKLKKLSPAFLLESLGNEEDMVSYSYIGLDTEEVSDYLVKPSTLQGDDSRTISYLQGLPPFYEGYIGYLSFENVQKLYSIKGHFLEHYQQILKCQSMIIFDHLKESIFIVYNAPINLQAYKQGVQRIHDVLLCLDHEIEVQSASIPERFKIESNMTKAQYLSKVNTIKDYIKKGDVFQVVLSQCFYGHAANIDSLLLYKSVRRNNPSSYLTYIRFKDRHLICSSPEMLVKCHKGRVKTAPIAGTRPIKNDGLDPLRATTLIKDPKELAEHTMLVDLSRNDLNKICQPGSLRINYFCQVKHYSKVMHLVTEIEGDLSKDISSMDVMISAFPAGTVSGAPKKRALEIIQELEPTPRDLYAGSIFYLGMDGSLNSCIAIRTIQIKDQCLSLQVGAGIVHDSIPELEYQETLNKAQALFDAINDIYKGGIQYDFSD